MNMATTSVGRPAAKGEHLASTSWGHVLGLVIGLPLLVGLILTAFAWPAANIAPRDLPLVVVGPEAAVSGIEHQLAAGLGEGAVEVTAVDSREAAVAAIEDRDAYGAIVATPGQPEVLIASGASPAVATMLAQGAAALAPSQGAAPTVTDVAPQPADDPHGAVFGVGMLPIVLGGLVTGVLVALTVRGRAQQLTAVALAAGVAAGAVIAILQGWLDALEGDWLVNAGVVALGVAAIAAVLVGLHSLVGAPGIGAVVLTMILLGAPLSAAPTAPELLPSGWGALGQLLPPGATMTALRGTSFFDGAGSGVPLLVLGAWVLVGAVLIGLGGQSTRTSPRS